MAAPAIGINRRRPPTGGLDRGHPLAIGLVFWADPSQGSDLVGGRIAAASGGVRRDDPGGLYFTSSTGQVVYGSGPLVGSGSSWSCIAAVNSGGSGGSKTFFAKRDSFAPSGNEVCFGINSSGLVTISVGNNFSNVASTGVGNNVEAQLAATATAATATAYIDAVNVGSVSADRRSGGGGSATIEIGKLVVENGETVGLGGGAVHWVAVWNRALTAAEVAEVYADPFQMFRR